VGLCLPHPVVLVTPDLTCSAGEKRILYFWKREKYKIGKIQKYVNMTCHVETEREVR
jgi:hypothetical protein